MQSMGSSFTTTLSIQCSERMLPRTCRGLLVKNVCHRVLSMTLVSFFRRSRNSELSVAFTKKDGEFRTLSAQIERPIATLTAYRKSLIHECVTGQRRITD